MLGKYWKYLFMYYTCRHYTGQGSLKPLSHHHDQGQRTRQDLSHNSFAANCPRFLACHEQAMTVSNHTLTARQEHADYEPTR